MNLNETDRKFLRLLVRREIKSRVRQIAQLEGKFGTDYRDVDRAAHDRKLKHAMTVLIELSEDE